MFQPTERPTPARAKPFLASRTASGLTSPTARMNGITAHCQQRENLRTDASFSLRQQIHVKELALGLN
jgi:hypothetical protein